MIYKDEYIRMNKGLKNEIAALNLSLQAEMQMSGRETLAIKALEHEVVVLNENLDESLREIELLHYAIKHLESK